METINWADILAECGNYRDGFVSIFRRYEGMPTDEKDGQGRTVKVTGASFAAHIGVNRETFRRWVRASEQDARAVRPARSKKDLTRDVTRAVRHEPAAVVDAIMSAPERTRDAIFDEIKLQRAGVDTSKANRKAANARADAITEPFRRAIDSMEAAIDSPFLMFLGAMATAAEALDAAQVSHGFTDEEHAKAQAALDEVITALMELSLEVNR